MAELDGTTITQAFCKTLEATTGMSKAEIERTGQRIIYRLGCYEWDDMGSYIDVELTLEIGKKLNSEQAYRITGAQFRVSVSTVKRVLNARDRALSEAN
jgi:hypothetical protein